MKSVQSTGEPVAGIQAVWRNIGRAHAAGTAAIPVSGTPEQLRLLSEALPHGSQIDGNEIVIVGKGAVFLERRAAVGAAIDDVNRRQGWLSQRER